MLIFVYTFPDGRFVPGFTRWLSLGWIAVSILPIPIFGAVYLNWFISPLYTLARTAFYCILILALLYRYRRMSTRLERQQIKWVIFAGAIAIGSLNVENLMLNVLPAYFPALGVLP
jgi:undecaprenyl pyrophosphate phosphatase UppP